MLYNRLLNFETVRLLKSGTTVPGPICKDTVIRRDICFVKVKKALGHVITVFSQNGNSPRGSCKNPFVVILETQEHSLGSLSDS
jgi:hypothetical protein